MSLIVLPAAFAQNGGAASAAGSGADGTVAGTAPAAGKSVSEADLPILEPGQTVPGTTGGTGAAGAGTAANAAPTSTVSLWDFGRMFIILALVVGVIYLVYFFLKKSSRRKIQENDLIRVLGSKALSGSRAIHLVEAAGGVYLIGSSDGGVELIAEIKDKESLDALSLRAEAQVLQTKKSFQEVLAGIFKPVKKTTTPLSESIELLKGQRDRLRKM